MVGPSRSWPLKDGFKSSIRHPRLKGAATSEDGDDIQQGLQEATELKSEKQRVKSVTSLREVNDWTLWRGWPTPKQKKGLWRCKSWRCVSTSHSQKFCPTGEKEGKYCILGRLALYQGIIWDEWL
jgi:hypothetical protein